MMTAPFWNESHWSCKLINNQKKKMWEKREQPGDLVDTFHQAVRSDESLFVLYAKTVRWTE